MDKVLQGLIALVDERQILVYRLEVIFQISGKPHLPGQIGPWHLVARVVLHGDVEKEQGLPLLFLLIQPDQVLIVALIGDISALFISPHIGTVLEIAFKVHLVKAIVGINSGPVPAGGAVGVSGHRAIAQGLHLTHQGGVPVGDIHLIGYRSGRQEGGGVAGEELILRVGGGAAKHGGIGIALDSILF